MTYAGPQFSAIAKRIHQIFLLFAEYIPAIHAAASTSNDCFILYLAFPYLCYVERYKIYSGSTNLNDMHKRERCAQFELTPDWFIVWFDARSCAGKDGSGVM